jgi:trimethylamine--corrinoid protein Co-methyltransferase
MDQNSTALMMFYAEQGLPCHPTVVPNAGLTNSKLVDAQAGYEKALSCMGGMLAGMHVLQFVGLIDALMAFDYGMTVIDNEISLMLKRVVRGMEFSEDNLAIDEINAIGPGGTFLTTDRTIKSMAVGAFLPDIADRQPRQMWMEAGGLEAQDRSLRKVKEILAEESRSLFSAAAEARIRAEFVDLVSGDAKTPDER